MPPTKILSIRVNKEMWKQVKNDLRLIGGGNIGHGVVMACAFVMENWKMFKKD